MKPVFVHPERIEFELTDRTERSFLFLRHVYRVRVWDGFCLRDSEGWEWRPEDKVFDSDGASVPHPVDWVIPAFDGWRYRRSAAGIHDPACRTGRLERRRGGTETAWEIVEVPRWKADWLLREGVEAEGGWWLTQKCYWGGVRVGAGVLRLRKGMARLCGAEA